MPVQHTLPSAASIALVKGASARSNSRAGARRRPFPSRVLSIVGGVGVTAVLGLGATGCRPEEKVWASAYQIDDLAQGIGGPKATARPGDFVIENDRIRLAILGKRNSLGPHTSGGSLIDADLQRDDPRFSQGNGLDQLAEVFPTINLNVARINEAEGEISILKDGSDGGEAVICTIGPEESFITLLDALWAIQWPAARPYFHLRTDYILKPGTAAVLIQSTVLFGESPSCADDISTSTPADSRGDGESLPLLDLALGGDSGGGVVFGDFYLQGGSVDVFTPRVGFDEETYVQGLLEQGLNTFTDPINLPFLAGTADRVSYALINASGNLFVPMFTSSQTVAVGAGVEGNGTFARFDATDGPYHYQRWFGVGSGDVGSAAQAVWEATGTELGFITGNVLEQSTGNPLSGVRVFVYEEGAEAPFIEWTTDVGMDTVADGSFGGGLPPGRYELMVHGEGRPDSGRASVVVKAGASQKAILESPRPGTVRFRVADETGINVPAKVSFFAASGTESPRDPVLGDGFIGGNPANVVFTASGSGEVILPPGKYVAVASRGIEYELDQSDVFEVDAASGITLDLQVLRSVDTSGWISGDFHVHAFRSHDSGVNLHQRALSMAAEGVEFLSSTDHDAVTDYGPAIQEMGIHRWLTSAVGLEVTTIEVGHFLGFPLQMDHLGDQGGAFDWTGMTPIEMIEGLRELGEPGGVEPLVFVGHPRDGILGYFDQFAVNPYKEEFGQPFLDYNTLATLSGNHLLDPVNFTMEFDAMELLNGKRFEMLRTPTAPELADYKAGGDTDEVDMFIRTMDEQLDLENGTYTLGYGFEGVIDDWFMLNNLGIRVTALGNSDTHDLSSVEAGCPRNFIMSDTDDPAFVSPADVAEAVRAGKVVASYGPFVRFYANGDERMGPGSDVSGGSVKLSIEVSSPGWFTIDRVELYENGALLEEWEADEIDNSGTINLADTITVNPTKDSWYVVIASGGDDMAPVFTPVEYPPIFLEDVVTGALAGIGLDGILSEAVPVPRAFPIHPFALTNPIWVDADGDGSFTPPGLPSWLVEPTEPAE